jgi:hypothetical protein
MTLYSEDIPLNSHLDCLNVKSFYILTSVLPNVNNSRNTMLVNSNSGITL